MRMGLVDLDHGDALADEVAGHPGGIRTGRLDPAALDLAEGPEPDKELAVAAGGDREGPGPEYCSASAAAWWVSAWASTPPTTQRSSSFMICIDRL